MKSLRSIAMLVGAVGALVVAIAVVLQSRELSVPPVRSCEVSPAATRRVALGFGAQVPAPTSTSAPLALFEQQTQLQTQLRAQAPARAQAIERCLTEISSRQSAALQYGWIAALAVLAVGVGLGLAAGRSGRHALAREVGSESPAPRTDGHTAVARGEATARAAGACERERTILATACMEVSDLVDSPALREQLLDALKASGVKPVEAGVGEPFDSTRHKAVGTIPTNDPVNDNTVAEIQRPGYVDRGKRVRYPEVLVFKWSGASE